MLLCLELLCNIHGFLLLFLPELLNGGLLLLLLLQLLKHLRLLLVVPHVRRIYSSMRTHM